MGATNGEPRRHGDSQRTEQASVITTRKPLAPLTTPAGGLMALRRTPAFDTGHISESAATLLTHLSSCLNLGRTVDTGGALPLLVPAGAGAVRASRHGASHHHGITLNRADAHSTTSAMRESNNRPCLQAIRTSSSSIPSPGNRVSDSFPSPSVRYL